VIEANGYGVNSATLHPDRTAFVAAGFPPWQTNSLSHLLPHPTARDSGPSNSASVRPCRRTRSIRESAVLSGGNFWVYVHDFATGDEILCNKGHHGPVYGVRFTPGDER
jgi:hypothetical protein